MVEKKNILLVENDIYSVKVIAYFLKDSFNVDHAPDGLTALKLAQSKKYSIILMDIDLGIGMNGLETANKINRIPGLENLPIVAVTAYALPGDREKFLAKGCTHYISKPFKKDEILTLLNDIISTL